MAEHLQWMMPGGKALRIPSPVYIPPGGTAGGMCWAGTGTAHGLPSSLQRENHGRLWGEAAGKSWEHHPLPPSCCWASWDRAWAGASSPALCYCSLHAPAWLGRYSQLDFLHIQVTSLRFFSFFFFLVQTLRCRTGMFIKESFPWQERDPAAALTAGTGHLQRHSGEDSPGRFPLETWSFFGGGK